MLVRYFKCYGARGIQLTGSAGKPLTQSNHEYHWSPT
jgi:hypothetical protein